MATISAIVRWADNTADLTRNLREGVNQIEATRASVDRMVQSLNGDKLVAAAHRTVAAIQEVGGAATLTASQAQRSFGLINDAIEKLERTGKTVPESMRAMRTELEAVATPTQTWADKLGNVQTIMQGLIALKVVLWATEAVTSIVRWADTLDNLSVATGVSVEGLQRLEAVGVTSGVSIDSLAKAVEQLQKHLDSPQAIQAIERMGLSYSHIRDLKPEDQFLEIAQAVAAIEDPVVRQTAAVDLFGKSWDTISPAIRKNIKEIADSSHVLTAQQIKDIDDVGDAWDRLLLKAKAYGAEVLLMAIPKAPPEGGWVRNITAGGVFDPTLDFAHQTDLAPKPPVTGLMTAVRQLPDDLTKVTIAGKTLEQQMEALAASNAWAALRVKVEGLGSAFAQFVELGKIGQNTGLNRPETLLPTFLSNFGGGMAAFGPQITNVDGAHQIGNGMAAFGPATLPNRAPSGVNLLSGLATSVPQSIIAALQGGGSVVQSVAGTMGAGIGTNLVKNFGDTITKNLGKTFGGAINAILPGLGALAAPLVSFIGKLFGKSEESSKVSPVRDEFFKMQGGLEKLNPLVQALSGNLNLVDAVFKAKTVDQYNAAIENLTDLLQFQKTAMADLTATAEKYGFTLAELGPALQRQNLDEQAQTLYKDFQILTAGGLDHVAILTRMSASVNDYLHNVLSLGMEVPNAMKPMLEAMAQQGLLTDAAGNKIDNLTDAGVSFAMTMSEGFQALISEVQKLTNAIAVGLGIAIENIPDPTITVHTKHDVGNLPSAPDAAGFNPPDTQDIISHTGSLIQSTGRILHFPKAHSGMMPDERLIMVQTGEAILQRSAVSALGLGGVRGMNAGQSPFTAAASSGSVPVLHVSIGDIQVVVPPGTSPDDEQAHAETFKKVLVNDVGGVYTAIQVAARKAVA